MSEIAFLNGLLFVAFILAPLMANSFFLDQSKTYSVAHKVCFAVVLLGALIGLKPSAIVRPLFCAFGLFLYLRKESKTLFSLEGIAGGIPFVFSLISSVWFLAGTYDAHLLGYDRAWSFYAALHGGFLGWLFVGCLAFLARKPNSSRVFLWGCYLSLVLFLFVAFGINGVPYIKRIGVIGFSALVPFLIGRYASDVKNKNRTSFLLAVSSLGTIVVSMALALSHEFQPIAPRFIFGLPTMVVTHGFINAIFVVPFFFFAIRFERNEPAASRSIL